MKVGIVRLRLHPWEAEIYESFQKLKINFIASQVDEEVSKTTKHECRNVDFISLFPSFLGQKALTKHFAKMSKPERWLEDLDALDSSEIYTSLSSQCARTASELNSKLLVSINETMAYHPITLAPPYVFNILTVRKRAYFFIAMTKKATTHLAKLGVPMSKVRVVYPGIDVTKFKPINQTYDKISILYAGRLVSHKGILVLLQAFRHLCKSVTDIELWVIGRGPLENYVRTYSKSYPVKYYGFVEREELPHFYQECDIFCLPSYDYRIAGIKVWEEQFGYVLVEAMASGLPIISTDCGAIPEVLGNGNIIVPQKSVHQLYLQLRRLIIDSELRELIGRSNRKRCESLFDSRKQGSMLEEIFLKALLNP